MPPPNDRYERLRAQFDALTRGLEQRSGRYTVPAERWREIVAWLFNRFIEILLSGASRFWSRLDSGEQTTLREFAKQLGLKPKDVVRSSSSAQRAEVIRIVRKGFGLRTGPSPGAEA